MVSYCWTSSCGAARWRKVQQGRPRLRMHAVTPGWRAADGAPPRFEFAAVAAPALRGGPQRTGRGSPLALCPKPRRLARGRRCPTLGRADLRAPAAYTPAAAIPLFAIARCPSGGQCVADALTRRLLASDPMHALHMHCACRAVTPSPALTPHAAPQFLNQNSRWVASSRSGAGSLGSVTCHPCHPRTPWPFRTL